MFTQLINWIKALFGKIVGYKTQAELQAGQRHKMEYEDTQRVNFAEIFGASLANKAVTDCNLTVTDSNDRRTRRSDLIDAVLQPMWNNFKGVLAQALGKGGKFLVPYVIGDRIYIAAVDQTDCVVNQTVGGEMVSLTVIADTREVGNQIFQRLIDYTLKDGVCSIRTRIVDRNGVEAAEGAVPEWASITPDISIGGVERLPVAYLRCPKDNRKNHDFYGVPITYGSEDIIRQLYECMNDLEDEYRLKHPFVGADEMLFGKDNKLPSNGLFKTFRATGELGGKSFWEVFDPAIRDTSYYNRYANLCALLEKSVGTSKGILTEPATFGATATEIRSANYDTFCLVSDIRKVIQKCFEDLAYAIDVYAERFGLSPAGEANDYKVTFDWDMSLTESSAETFDQLAELESRGLISGARLNAWVTGQGMEEAQAEIDAVQKEKESQAENVIYKKEEQTKAAEEE